MRRRSRRSPPSASRTSNAGNLGIEKRSPEMQTAFLILRVVRISSWLYTHAKPKFLKCPVFRHIRLAAVQRRLYRRANTDDYEPTERACEAGARAANTAQNAPQRGQNRPGGHAVGAGCLRTQRLPP